MIRTVENVKPFIVYKEVLNSIGKVDIPCVNGSLEYNAVSSIKYVMGIYNYFIQLMIDIC